MAESDGGRCNPYDSLALLSGGPDSTTLLYHLVKNETKKPLALHFSTGLGTNRQEFRAARALAGEIDVPLQVIDISHFVAVGGGAHPTIHSEAHVLRFGTAVLLSMASAFAIQMAIPGVWVALHKEDAEEATEYSEKFIKFINSGIDLIGEKCSVRAPFHSWTKGKILTLGVELKVPLERTWSCIAPIKGVQCGVCGACRARREAFKTAEIRDLTRYVYK